MDKYFKNIKELIENNLVEVKKQEITVNNHTLMTYFNIGKLLVEAQGGETRAKYGDNLIKNYAIKLSLEYGRFYSDKNLRNMRQFFLTFKIWNSLSSKLTWTHYRTLLTIKNESKRNYYINSAIDHNFSVRQLKEYIKTNAYERLVKKDNIQLKYMTNTKNSNVENNILDMIKNPILIKIDKNIDRITEKALRKYMLETIEKTMLELGVGFAYVGSEIPIRLNNKVHRPDLVFFNIDLNCYTIFEIKLNELKKSDIGQIEFYINYYDSEIKKHFHNPTIGITISKRIDSNIIKYNSKNNIKHTTYKISN